MRIAKFLAEARMSFRRSAELTKGLIHELCECDGVKRTIFRISKEGKRYER